MHWCDAFSLEAHFYCLFLSELVNCCHPAFINPHEKTFPSILEMSEERALDFWILYFQTVVAQMIVLWSPTLPISRLRIERHTPSGNPAANSFIFSLNTSQWVQMKEYMTAYVLPIVKTASCFDAIWLSCLYCLGIMPCSEFIQSVFGCSIGIFTFALKIMRRTLDQLFTSTSSQDKYLIFQTFPMCSAAAVIICFLSTKDD